MSHVDALAVGNLDGAEGVVGAEFEAREGRTVRVRAGGEVVDHVRGVRHVAEGAAQAEAHAVAEVDELGAGELAGLVLDEWVSVGHSTSQCRSRDDSGDTCSK